MGEIAYVEIRGSTKRCSLEECARPHATRGLCMTHYNKLRLAGQLMRRPESVACTGCATEIPVAPKGPIPQVCDACTGKRRKRQTRANHRRTVLSRYGLTEDQYLAMIGRQNGVCAICHSPPNHGNGAKYGVLSIDHDHATGKVRGLLCGRCNSAIGLLLDSPVLCEMAADYLQHGPAMNVWEC